MINAVIFDMYETLITLFSSEGYFSWQMAIDAGISEENFQRIWSATENDRATGKMTLEEAVTIVLEKNNCFSQQKLDQIVHKRIAAKEESFRHMHSEIFPLLYSLKQRNIKVGLISNCFSEEARIIEESVLYPFFDAVCLSYREHIVKPDPEIYVRCMNKLSVHAGECLYTGDGGSMELETAKKLGMQVVQAVWYLKDGTLQPTGRKNQFRQAETPLEILQYVARDKV